MQPAAPTKFTPGERDRIARLACARITGCHPSAAMLDEWQHVYGFCVESVLDAVEFQASELDGKDAGVSEFVGRAGRCR